MRHRQGNSTGVHYVLCFCSLMLTKDPPHTCWDFLPLECSTKRLLLPPNRQQQLDVRFLRLFALKQKSLVFVLTSMRRLFWGIGLRFCLSVSWNVCSVFTLRSPRLKTYEVIIHYMWVKQNWHATYCSYHLWTRFLFSPVIFSYVSGVLHICTINTPVTWVLCLSVYFPVLYEASDQLNISHHHSYCS